MSSIFRRHPDPDDLTDEDDVVDPELRLRTVRTAASTIAESIRTEERAEKRKTMRKKRSFFRRNTDKKRPQPSTSKPESIAESAAPSEASAAPPIKGLRRNIYVNMPLPHDELDPHNEPIVRYVRNKVRTTSQFTLLTPPALPPPYLYITPHLRIYHPHLHTQEPLRAVPSVSSPPTPHPPLPLLTPLIFPSRVANLYFLALVVVQGASHLLNHLSKLTLSPSHQSSPYSARQHPKQPLSPSSSSSPSPPSKTA